ncbi:hypothetical protein GCM10017688_21950 [Streptomyces ramulosus]
MTVSSPVAWTVRRASPGNGTWGEGRRATPPAYRPAATAAAPAPITVVAAAAAAVARRTPSVWDGVAGAASGPGERVTRPAGPAAAGYSCGWRP